MVVEYLASMKDAALESFIESDKYDPQAHAHIQGQLRLLNDFTEIPDMLKKFNLNKQP